MHLFPRKAGWSEKWGEFSRAGKTDTPWKLRNVNGESNHLKMYLLVKIVWVSIVIVLPQPLLGGEGTTKMITWERKPFFRQHQTPSRTFQLKEDWFFWIDPTFVRGARCFLSHGFLQHAPQEVNHIDAIASYCSCLSSDSWIPRMTSNSSLPVFWSKHDNHPKLDPLPS